MKLNVYGVRSLPVDTDAEIKISFLLLTTFSAFKLRPNPLRTADKFINAQIKSSKPRHKHNRGMDVPKQVVSRDDVSLDELNQTKHVRTPLHTLVLLDGGII